DGHGALRPLQHSSPRLRATRSLQPRCSRCPPPSAQAKATLGLGPPAVAARAGVPAPLRLDDLHVPETRCGRLPGPHAVDPRGPRWENYTEVLFGENSILPAFGNSVFVALLRVTGELATATLAGYAFAKLRFRGRNIVFIAYLATSLIPAQLLLVPRFVYFQNLGLYDTLWALILPGMFT